MKYVLLTLLSLVLLLGGFWLFGTATGGDVDEAWRAPIFIGGILSITLCFAIPLAILPAMRK